MELDGTGSPENPYKIRCSSDLAEIQNEIDAVFELVSDIDCTNLETPISVNFTGELIGNTHTLYNITEHSLFSSFDGVIDSVQFESCSIHGDEEKYSGVVAGAIGKKSTVRNLRLADITVTGNGDIGVVSGWLNGSAVLENVSVFDSTVIGSYAGGVVAHIPSGYMSDAFVDGIVVDGVNITGTEQAGGITSHVNSHELTNLTVTDSTIQSSEGGALFGWARECNIKNAEVTNCSVSDSSVVSVSHSSEFENITVQSTDAVYGFAKELMYSELSDIEIQSAHIADKFTIGDLVQPITTTETITETPENLIAVFEKDDITAQVYSNNLVVQKTSGNNETLFRVGDDTEQVVLDQINSQEITVTVKYVADTVLHQLSVEQL